MIPEYVQPFTDEERDTMRSLTPVQRLLYHERVIRRPDLYPKECAILHDMPTMRLNWHFGGSSIWVPSQVQSSAGWQATLRQLGFVTSAVRGRMNEGWTQAYGASDHAHGRKWWWETIRHLWVSGLADLRIEEARGHALDLITALDSISCPLDWWNLPDADKAQAALLRAAEYARIVRTEQLSAAMARTRHTDLFMVEERWFSMHHALDAFASVLSRWEWVAGSLASRLADLAAPEPA